MDRMCAILFSLLVATTSLAGCFGEKDKIDDGGIVVDNEQDSNNQTDNTSTTEDDGFTSGKVSLGISNLASISSSQTQSFILNTSVREALLMSVI